jgi:hypothetical protein
MIPENPINLHFYKSKPILHIKAVQKGNRSSRKKFYVTTANQDYFLKFVGSDIGHNVFKLYTEIMQHRKLVRHLPQLWAVEKGWLIYQCIGGQQLVKYFLTNLYKKSFGEELNIIYSIGNFLSIYHKALIQDWITANDFLKPYLRKVNLPSDNDKLLKVPIVKTYNDFTMRNILITQSKEFFCLDIDAAFHPQYPHYTIPYHDISITIINILSLDIIPLLFSQKIKRAIYKFLSGYFHNNSEMSYSKYLLTAFIQLHYNGYFMDRDIRTIYARNRYIRFRKMLDKSIMQGEFGFLPTTISF